MKLIKTNFLNVRGFDLSVNVSRALLQYTVRRLHLEYFNQEISIYVYKILQTSFSTSSILPWTCATV